jgi:hypothetical protein
MIALLAGAVMIWLPYLIFVSVKSHVDILAQDEWHS